MTTDVTQPGSAFVQQEGIHLSIFGVRESAARLFRRGDDTTTEMPGSLPTSFRGGGISGPQLAGVAVGRSTRIFWSAAVM